MVIFYIIANPQLSNIDSVKSASTNILVRFYILVVLNLDRRSTYLLIFNYLLSTPLAKRRKFVNGKNINGPCLINMPIFILDIIITFVTLTSF